MRLVTRHFESFAAWGLVLALTINIGQAGSGNFNPYLITYNTNSQIFTGATTGTSLGTYARGSASLYIDGGQIQTWTDGSDSKVGANFLYRSYRTTGGTAGTFTSVVLPSVSSSGNNTMYEKKNLGAQMDGSANFILGALYNGSYTIDYYFQAIFNWGSQYNSAGASSATSVPTGSFYTATFTLTGYDYYLDQASSSATQSATTGGAAQLTGSVGIGKFGGGTVTLNNTANNYTGRTLVAAGTLQTTAAGVIPDGSDVLIKSGAVLDLNSNNETVASVGEYAGSDGGTITLGSGTLTVNGSNRGNKSQNSITGTGNVTFSSSGTTYFLYGNQGYTGTTTVTAGTVQTSVAMSSAFAINGGTFETLGANQISDTVGFTLGGGTLKIGGTETFGNNGVTLSTSTSSSVSINSGVTATIGGALTGGGSLTKSDTGVLVLNAAHSTYSGTTTLSAGTLRLGNDTAIGTGGLTINGGTLASSGSSVRSIANNVTLGGDVTFGDATGTGTLVLNGTLGLGANTRTLTTAVDTTIGGAVSNGSLTKAGGSALTLSSDSSSFSTLTINAGSVAINGNTTVTGLAGSGTGAVSIASTKALTVNNSADQTFAQVISGSGGLTKTGSAILNLTGTANTYTGTTAINAGMVTISGDGSLGGTSAAISLGGGYLGFNGTFTLNSGRATTIAEASSGFDVYGSQTATYNGAIGETGGARAFDKKGTGTLVLGGNNTYTGATTISVGVARATSDTAFGTTAGGVSVTSAAAVELSGGRTIGAEALTLNGSGIGAAGALRNIQNDNSWAGNVTLGSASTIASDSGTLTLSGTVTHGGNRLTVLGNSGVTISGAMSGTGNSDILKQGSGALTLSADNSGLNPSGVTSVYIDQGTVYLNNNNAGGAKGIELGSGVSGAGSAALYAIGGRSIANAITIQSENTTALTIGSDSTSDDNTFTGNVTIEKTANFNAGSGRTVTFTNGVLSGAGGVTKTGTGTLSLLGANTFSGNVIISAGTLSITNANSLGRGDFNFGNGNTLTTLLVNSNTTITNTFRVYNAAYNAVVNVAANTTNTISGKLTQDGTDAKTKFGKDGDGTLILNNSTSDFKGQIQVGRGTVILGHNNALGSNTSVNDRGVDLGLNVGDAVTSTDAAFLASGGVAVSQSIYVAPTNSNSQRTIGLSGSGTATFNNEIRMEAGSSLTVRAGTSSTDQVTISGAITGQNGTTQNLIKNEAGTLVLSGSSANTYGGSTTINSGMLRLAKTAGVNAIASGTIAVNSGGTLLLGAANQIGDTTDITLSGGTLSTAGNADVVRKLTVSANSTIQGMNPTSGSAFTFSDIDLGTYAGSGGSTLTFLNSSGTSYGLGTVIQLSTVAASSWTGFGADRTVALNNFESKISFADANLKAQINFGGGTTGTTLTVAAIPEPKAYIAAGALALLIGMAEYRRRRKTVSSKA